MVDFLSMFRRRPAKRGRTGFGRARDSIAVDVAGYDDGYGEMVPSAVRDAPSIARDGQATGFDFGGPPQHAETPPAQPRPNIGSRFTSHRSSRRPMSMASRLGVAMPVVEMVTTASISAGESSALRSAERAARSSRLTAFSR